jgi:DNA excision repair protein ERCC-2
LDFQPKIKKDFDIVLPRNAIQPLTVTRGVDLLQISSRYEDRENAGNIRNYGNLLVELSSVVPDGIVCFFTSYRYMEHIIIKWEEMKILEKIRENKLIYIETKDHFETILALENYKQACDNGRGAVFFSIARGKVSEGVDFAGHYGRCVLMFGIPY